MNTLAETHRRMRERSYERYWRNPEKFRQKAIQHYRMNREKILDRRMKATAALRVIEDLEAGRLLLDLNKLLARGQ